MPQPFWKVTRPFILLVKLVSHVTQVSQTVCDYQSTNLIFFSRWFRSAPGPPDDVRATPVSRKEIRVRWKQPKEPNGIIREYKLFFSTVINRPPVNDSSNNVYMLRTDGNKTSQYLKNLESETVYYFWVRARTSVGTGNASEVVKQRTVEESK
jgi:hypothetical protein